MTPEQISLVQIKLVQQSWDTVKPIASETAALFYKTLFEMDPALKTLFPQDLTDQGVKLMSMLSTAVKLLDDPDKLIPIIQDLGVRHVGYGTRNAHYDTVGAVLLKTLATSLGDGFTQEVKQAWTAIYNMLSTTMIDAANNAEKIPQENMIGDAMKANTEMTSNNSNAVAVRLQGALDQSTTAFMMIDRDFAITYFNATTLKLLKYHEATFKKVWPTFVADPDVIMGSNIDMFHKDPSHQRKLLSDPNNLPFKTDIHIEHLTIELNVTAIMDDKGEYIGNSLEWYDVTEDRAKSAEVGRLTSTVEGMTTNLMMADTKGNIVYANPAVCTMMRRRETQLRNVFSDFRVDNLVGMNIDYFHKNPKHQQNILGDPKNLPYTAEFTVAGVSFRLTAMALTDDKGNHVGTGVQWLDLTEEIDTQRQVENIINDAISGKLDSRVGTEKYNGFMKVLGDSINHLMDAIVDPVNEAINVAQALAEGDLTQTMDGEYSGEFLVLANAMNGSIDKMANMVDEIRTASTNVYDSAKEIAQGNNELSQRTETQASSLEETASAMEELTSTVQQNAENATKASKLSASVMLKASNGGGVVKNAITAMSDINKSSKKIADIISVIDEIAFQTNLLALNAAVEAARAGEQGRGFAVVAAEVRNLAQRSAGAAKEIKSLINDSVEAVGQGTKLVDETGQTFSELVAAIEEVSQMIDDIDSASREQSAGIVEVSAAVSQMDEMTQQNAALVEEAAASSISMEEQSQLLMDQVKFFDNGFEEVVIPTPQKRSRTHQTRVRPIGRTMTGPTSKQALAPRNVPKQRLTRSDIEIDDEWEEF